MVGIEPATFGIPIPLGVQCSANWIYTQSNIKNNIHLSTCTYKHQNTHILNKKILSKKNFLIWEIIFLFQENFFLGE
jgi:hypothetical protein